MANLVDLFMGRGCRGALRIDFTAAAVVHIVLVKLDMLLRKGEESWLAGSLERLGVTHKSPRYPGGLTENDPLS